MIRLITTLCKKLIEELDEEHIVQDTIDKYIHYGKLCPHYGSFGTLESYGGYSRGLSYRRKVKTVDSIIWIRRFECSSCGGTHALLPDILTPYSIYSLRFKLLAITAYFERGCSVAALCESFDIAVSTLYEWLKLLIYHKDLMIGVLKSKKTFSLEFLHSLIDSEGLSDILHRFFNKYGFSFMQGASMSAAQSVPP
jgi:hypothetical protein